MAKFQAHILGIKDPLISTKEILELGNLSRQGLPLGSIEFQRKIESIINRKIIPSPKGRPRKNG